MRFTVTARSAQGEVMFEHASLLDALAQALGLSASGLSEVRIADGTGSARTPADLYRVMFGMDDAKSAIRPMGGVESMAIAA